MDYYVKKEISGTTYYGCVDSMNAVKKVTDIKVATKFQTKEDAQKLLVRASKKLKNFKIYEVRTESKQESSAEINDKEKTAVNSSAPVKMSHRRSFTPAERIAVYNKSEGRCAICGEFVPYDEFTVDHIIPLAKGGDNKLTNLQCACRVCNSIKQDILPEDLLDRLTIIMLHQLSMKKNKKYRKIIKKAC